MSEKIYNIISTLIGVLGLGVGIYTGFGFNESWDYHTLLRVFLVILFLLIVAFFIFGSLVIKEKGQKNNEITKLNNLIEELAADNEYLKSELAKANIISNFLSKQIPISMPTQRKREDTHD